MKKRGFTLIELLVVIAIIGILALLIIINLAGAAERSRYAKAKAELKTIDDAISIAYVEASAKPANTGWATLGFPGEVGTYSIDNFKDSKDQNLIQNVPERPAADWGQYRVYIQGVSNHAAGIKTPTSVNDTTYCVFKGGSVLPSGTLGVITASDVACEPAP